MKTIESLRADLCKLFDDLKADECDVKIAAEMNNTAGKIIGTLKVQLEYSALRKEEPSIPFLDKAVTDPVTP